MADKIPAIGIAHFTALDLPPLELVSLAARIGYSHVGIRLCPVAPGATHYPIAAGSPEMRALKARMSADGIRVFDVETVVMDSDFKVADLNASLESAAELGAERLGICCADTDHSRLTANFAALCQLAGPYGISVDIECMAWRSINSIPAALKLIQAANYPNAGILVDALHLSRTGGSPDELRKIPPELIRSVQICDAPAKIPETTEAIITEARSNRLAPGDGELPLKAILAALPKEATISVEVPMAKITSNEERARFVFEKTMTWLRE